MKIYISHASKYDYKSKLYNPIKQSNLMKENTLFFPHDGSDKVVNTKKIIANYDLVLAEVSLPATGQGIELGWADDAKTPIVCLYEKGRAISSSLKFITKDFIEYEDTTDMIKQINEYVENIKK